MGEHGYKVAYQARRLDPPQTKEEIRLDGPEWGGCDHLFVASVVGTPGGPGPLSVAFASLDGDTGKHLPPMAVFQLWAMLGHRLARDLGSLPPGLICGRAFREVQEMVRRFPVVTGGDGID